MKTTLKKVFTILSIVYLFFSLFSCSVQDDLVKNNGYKGKIKMKDAKFEELMNLSTFRNAYGKLAKRNLETSSLARTALEDEYGFSIVTSVPVKIINEDDMTYYIMLIERSEQQDSLKFENLIIRDKNDTITAGILKYQIAEKAIKADHESYYMNILSTTPTSIEIEEQRLFMNCITTTVIWCCDVGYYHNYAPMHLATAACLSASNCIVQMGYSDCTLLMTGGPYNVGVVTPGPSGSNGNNNGGSSTNGPNTPPIPNVPIPCVNCYEDPDDDCNTSKEDIMEAFPTISAANAEILANLINEKGKDYGIDNKFKLQHFLSQAGHESNGFTSLSVTENTNYTTAARLLEIFPKYFSTSNPDLEHPSDYVGNAEAIGSYVYCCRMGNGNKESGDGYKYRGRGFIQLTGKNNYQAFQNDYNAKFNPDIDIISNPSLIATDVNLAILSALWFFQKNVIPKTKLRSNIDDTVKNVTLKVNSGIIGLPDRSAKFSSCQTSIDCID